MAGEVNEANPSAISGAATTHGEPSLLDRLKRVGPAIVVAAVVLGPGSIVNASRVGCEYGYQLLWVVPLAGILMMAMTSASMAIGVLSPRTLCTAVADSFGRPAAWAVGTSLLIAIILFQASNNNALLMAAEGFWEPSPGTVVGPLGKSLLLLLVNAAVIVLLTVGGRHLYRWVERAMAVLVGAMVVAFALSMFASSPDLAEIAGGLVPSLHVEAAADPAAATAADVTSASDTISLLSIAGLMATTFSVAGAFYQSYQVREKGWAMGDLRVGITDSVVGIGTLTVITAMVLITAAAALHGVIPASELTSAATVAKSLEPLFGAWAKIIFAVGVLAGAVSSFVVNALIGGVVFSDAIGAPSQLSSRTVRTTTLVTLILGWLVASIATLTGINLVNFIVLAQSLTVFAFPILAAVLLWQLHQLDTQRLPVWVKPLSWLGLLVVLALTVRTTLSLIDQLFASGM